VIKRSGEEGSERLGGINSSQETL